MNLNECCNFLLWRAKMDKFRLS